MAFSFEIEPEAVRRRFSVYVVIAQYVRHQEAKERREEKERKSYELFSDPPGEKP